MVNGRVVRGGSIRSGMVGVLVGGMCCCCRVGAVVVVVVVVVGHVGVVLLHFKNDPLLGVTEGGTVIVLAEYCVSREVSVSKRSVSQGWVTEILICQQAQKTEPGSTTSHL